MQILNISVMNRPAKLITSWTYPLYNSETLYADVDSFKLTLWEVPKAVEYVQVAARPSSLILSDLVTYTSIMGGTEILQVNMIRPASLVIADMVTYSTLEVDIEYLTSTISPVSLVIRDVLIRTTIPPEIITTGISSFQLILGGD